MPKPLIPLPKLLEKKSRTKFCLERSKQARDTGSDSSQVWHEMAEIEPLILEQNRRISIPFVSKPRSFMVDSSPENPPFLLKRLVNVHNLIRQSSQFDRIFWQICSRFGHFVDFYELGLKPVFLPVNAKTWKICRA